MTENEINQFNEFADYYNARLERVLNDKSLLSAVDDWLDEQKAVAIIDGGLSESEAETLVSQTENIRRVVLAV